MSWICPYCGTENQREPLNSRHVVGCRGCQREMTAPEEVEAERAEQLKELDTALCRARWGLSPIVEQLSSYRQEVIDLEQELKEKKDEIREIQSSIDVLKNAPIYRGVDRAAKARLDHHQVKLPFEVSACA